MNATLMVHHSQFHQRMKGEGASKCPLPDCAMTTYFIGAGWICGNGHETTKAVWETPDDTCPYPELHRGL